MLGVGLESSMFSRCAVGSVVQHQVLFPCFLGFPEASHLPPKEPFPGKLLCLTMTFKYLRKWDRTDENKTLVRYKSTSNVYHSEVPNKNIKAPGGALPLPFSIQPPQCRSICLFHEVVLGILSLVCLSQWFQSRWHWHLKMSFRWGSI